MVAVISSANLGVVTANGSERGTPGSSGSGQQPDLVYVNRATGNLVIRRRDEVLAAVGPDLALVRTYNSQGLLDDDNGDNWRLSVHQSLYGLTGTVNTTGSTIRKVFGDGADVLYTYDGSAYVSTEGDGAHDTLTYNSSAGQWTWRDGSARTTETFDANGRLVAASDADGNSVTYGYTGDLLTSIADASGQVTTLTYTGSRLTSISVSTSQGLQTRTSYGYDSLGRLEQVIVDLTLEDGPTLVDANSDGLYETVNSETYVTTYSYEGATHLVASITQGDGTRVEFDYVDGRVSEVREGAPGAQRVTRYEYSQETGNGGAQNVSADPSVITDSQTTSYSLDDDALTTPPQPGWSTEELFETSGTAANDPMVAFDAAGNGFAIWREAGNLFARRYTASTASWGAQFALDNRTNTVSAPSLSVDAGGNALVAWVQSNGTANSIYANFFDATTSTWTGPVLQEATNNAAATAAGSVVTAINGSAGAAVFVQSDGTVNSLYASGISSGAWRTAELIEAGTAAVSQPAVALDGNGNIAVTWLQADATAASIFANRRDSSSSSWSGAFALEGIATAASNPSVVADAAGNLIYVWRASNNVYANHYDAATGQIGPAITLDTRTNTTAIPSIAIDAQSGNAIVAWVQSNGTANSVYASRYTASTSTWTAPALLETSNLAVATGLGTLVTSMKGNRAAVAWLQTDGTVNDLYGAIWDGSTWSAPALLEAGATAAAQPTIALDDSGNIAVLFQQTSGVASIYSTRYANVAGGPSYYTVVAGDTWQSIANTLYGIDSAAAGSALADEMGNVSLTTGMQLTGFPGTLDVTIPIPAYYDVPVSPAPTWDSVALAVYGSNDAALVQALIDSYGATPPTLTAGMQLLVPTSLAYGEQSVFQRTDVFVRSHPSAAEQVTTFLHDENGRLASVQSPVTSNVVLRTDYVYDSEGNLTSVIEDPAGLNRITTFRYDANGNVRLIRDSGGNTITRTYNGANQILTETKYLGADPDAAEFGQSPTAPLTTRYVYEPTGNTTRLRFTISADGRVTEYQYNESAASGRPLGSLAATLKYMGVGASSLYTAAPSSESDLEAWVLSRRADAQRTDYFYDVRGQVSRATSYAATDANGVGLTAGASVTQFVYDQRGNLLQTIAPRGSAATADGVTSTLPYATTFTYDSLGRQRQTIQWIEGGSTESISSFFDDRNNRSETTAADGLVTTVSYNAAGDVLSIRNAGPGLPGPSEITYTHDSSGRLRFVTDATGVRQHVLYDAAGRKVADIDADGTLTEYIYNGASQIIKTIRYADALPAGVLAGLVESLPTGGVRPANVAFDAIKTAIPTTVGRNLDQITRNVYDAAGRLEYTIDEVGAVARNFYDGANRVTDVVRFAARVTILTPGEVTSQEIAGLVNLNDADNRRTRNFYDADGNLLGTLDGEGYFVGNFYDAAGFLFEQIAYATAVRSEYWQAQTIAGLNIETDNDDQSPTSPERDISTRYFYDQQGRRVGVLDGENNLTETRYYEDGAVERTIRYDYDQFTVAPGAKVGDLVAQVSDARTRNTVLYAYDGAGRVVRETMRQGSATAFATAITEHEYDAGGNRIRTTAAVDADERTVRTQYDALGRVIRELSARGSERLDAGDDAATTWARYGTSYVYDLAGRRVSSSTQAYDPVNGTQTLASYFYYDEDGRVRFTVNSLGEITENLYDALGQLTQRISYLGRLDPALVADLDGGLLTETVRLQLRAVHNPLVDASTTYTYRLTGRLATETTAAGSQTTYVYNAFGEVETKLVVDAEQNALHSYEYDRRGALEVLRWDPNQINRKETYSYDAFGRLEFVEDQYGNRKRFHYDALGRVVSAFDALNHERRTTYDAFSRTLETFDAYGNRTAYAYDEVNRSMTVETPEGVDVTTQYNEHGQVFTVSDANNVTIYQYDKDGQLISVSDGLGAVESRSYDSAGRQVVTGDGRGVLTRFSYDATGRVLTRTVDVPGQGVQGPTLQLQTVYRYDGLGRVEQVTEPGNSITTTSYDRDGRVREVSVDPGFGQPVIRTRYDYDIAARTTTITEGYQSAQPRVARYTYDVLGRRVAEVIDPGSGINPATQQDYLNLTTEYKYDRNGNVTRRIVGGQRSDWFVYDANNKLRFSVDAAGSVIETTYDDEQRVIAVRHFATKLSTAQMSALAGADTPSVGQVIVGASNDDRLNQTIYDLDGREKYLIDAVGAVTEHSYDTVGNLSRVRQFARRIPVAVGVPLYATTGAVTSALQSAGNDTANISANDRIEWNAYDLRGRVSFVQRAITGPSGDLRTVVSGLQYDGAGNLTAMTAFSATRAVSDSTSLVSWAQANAAGSQRTRMWYDGAGRRVATLDAAGFLHEIRHDDVNRSVTEITHAIAPTIPDTATAADIYHRTNGVTIAVAATNQSTTTVQDAAGRTRRITDALGNFEEFGYDAVGNRTSARDKNGNVTTFAYDGVGRLRSTTDAALKTESYTYDAVGNKRTFTNKNGDTWTYDYYADGLLRTETSPSVAITRINRSAGAQPTLSVGTESGYAANIVTYLEYDAFGNVTRRSEAYGSFDERTTRYGFDQLGRQVRIEHPAVSLYNGASDDLTRIGTAVTRADDPPVVLTTITTYDAFGNVTVNKDVAGQLRYRVYDALGRVRFEIEPSIDPQQPRHYVTEHRYDAFGNEIDLIRYANVLTSTPVVGAGANAGSISLADTQSAVSAIGNTNLDRKITKTYDRVNQLHSVTQTAAFVFDATATNPLHRTFTAGMTTFYEYSAAGQLTREARLVNTLGQSITDPAVDSTRNRWAFTTYYYDSRGLKTAELDALGYLTSYGYTENGEVEEIREHARPLGTNNGAISSSAPSALSLDPAQYGHDRVTRLAYDALNRLETETRVGVVYSDADGNALAPANLVTHYKYDGVGNQTEKTVDGLGSTYTFYDELGRVVALVEPTRNTGAGSITPLTLMYRDAHGNLVRQIQYARGTNANPTAGGALPQPIAGDSLDRQTLFFVDAHGKVLQTQDPTGASRFASYNARGDVAKEWQIVRNPLDPSVATDDRVDAIVTAYEYDALGRQTTSRETQIAGAAPIQRMAYYNAFGEVVAKGIVNAANPSGDQERFEYDQAGHLWRSNTGDGVYKVYLFNLAGQATAEIKARYSTSGTVDLSGANPLATSANDVYQYLASGTLRTETDYDLLGRVLAQRQPAFTAHNPQLPIGAEVLVDVLNNVPYLYFDPADDATLTIRVYIDGVEHTVVNTPLSSESGPYKGVNLTGLANGAHAYRIAYSRPGDSTPIAAVQGTFTYGSSTVTTVTQTDTFAVGLIQSIDASIVNGSAVVTWTVSPGSLGPTQLEVFIGGSWQPITTTFDESTATASFSVPATGTYQYRITNSNIGFNEAVARGTLTFTAGSSTPTTALTIYETSPDVGIVVGTLGVTSGRYLSWETSNVGDESGYALSATIRLQQGGTVINLNATSSDSGTTRTFTVDLGTLGSGTWQYTISHIRNGEVVGAAAGVLTSSGTGTVRTVSGALVNAGIAPAAAAPIGGVAASHTGSAVNFGWATSGDPRISGVLQLSTDGVNWGAAYSATLTGTESAYRFELTGLSIGAGTYYYRITESALGQALSVATGTLTVNGGSSTSSTTLAIADMEPDVAQTVGTISVSGGTTLTWSADLTGTESGYELSASIRVQQGGTIYDRVAQFSDSGSSRIFSVYLGDLVAGTWQYKVTQMRNGTVVGARAGSFTTSGPSTSRIISNVAVYADPAEPSPTPIGALSTSITGGGTVTVSWVAPNSPTTTATLELAPAGSGSWQSYSASLSGSEGGYTFTVGNINRSPGTYDYRITQYHNGQVRNIATGSLTITGASSSTSTGVTGISPSPAYEAVGVVSVSASAVPQASGSWVQSSYADYDPVYDEGQIIDYTPVWRSSNIANLSWSDVGYQSLNVILRYHNSTGQDTYVHRPLGPGYSTGAQIEWWDSTPGNGTHGPGGFQYINAVEVYDANWNLLRYSGYYNSNTQLTFAAPADTNYQALVTINGWQYSATRSGSQFIVNLGTLTAGTYSFQVMQYTGNAESPQNVATRSGQFSVSGSSASVLNQSGDPPYLAGVSASGSNLFWNAASGGASVSVTLAGYGALTPQTSNGVNYSASFYGVPSGTYAYTIQYVSGGNVIRRGTGTISINTTVTNYPPTVSATNPNNSLYPVANVVPGASNDTLSWSYPTGGVPTTVTVQYSINGVAQTPLNYSGPGSITFSQITGNQSASIAYAITYRRNDNSAVYAHGSGLYQFTVSSPTNPGTLGNLTQSAVYPSVPEIVSPTDLGNGLMRWSPAANSGSDLVQVRYHLASESTFGSWTNATAVSGGYTFNFGALAEGTYVYEIRYAVSGQDPYRFDWGFVAVDHTTNVTPPSASAGQPTGQTQYAVANVVPTASANDDVLSWNHPTGGIPTTVTVSYSINGVAQTPLIFSGPNSIEFSQVTGNQNAVIDYTIVYRRNDNSRIYALGTGTFNFNVTTTSSSSNVGVSSQSPAYPSVPGIPAPTDAGNGVMQWTQAANTPATDLVQVRYREQSGAFSGWLTATHAGGGTYRFDFNSLPNSTYYYEIRYLVAGQDPYRFDRGSFQIAHSTIVVDPTVTNSVSSQLVPIAGFTALGNGEFGWTTAPNSPSDMRFRYRLVGTSDWTLLNPAPTFAGGYYRVNLSGFSGDFDFEVLYVSGGDTVPYAATGGRLTLNAEVDANGAVMPGVLPTLPAAPTQTQTVDRWGNVLSLTTTFNELQADGTITNRSYSTRSSYNQFDQAVEVAQPQSNLVNVDQQTRAITNGTDSISRNYYDLYGRLVATRDGNGNLSKVAYNEAGQLISETHADGGVKSFVYDAFGQKIQVRDEANYLTNNAYDRAGRLVGTASEIDAGAFAQLGLLPGVVPAFLPDEMRIVVKHFGYDDLGRRISETSGEKMADNVSEETRRYVYDLQGNLIAYHTATGGVVRFEYDAQGRRTRHTYNTDLLTDEGDDYLSWQYDYFGHTVAHRDLGGTIYSYVYDQDRTWHLLTQTSTGGENGGQLKNYAYDNGNHLTTIDDVAVGRLTEYFYDGLGRRSHQRTRINGVMHEDTRTTYDDLGRILHLSGRGFSVTYSYDAAGNRTHIDAHYASSTGIQHQDLWYQYDSMNRVKISQGRRVGDEVATLRLDDNWAGTLLEYDQRGMRTAATERRSANEYVRNEYVYDGLGRLDQITELSFAVDESGQPVFQNPRLVDDRAYDRASRVVYQMSVDPSSGFTRYTNTTYNDGGLMTYQTVDKLVGGTPRRETEMEFGNESGYDAAGNVKQYFVRVFNDNGTVHYTSTNLFDYRKGESYQETYHEVQNSAVIEGGITRRYYNANGELIRFVDEKDQSRNRYFANNAEGLALTVVRGSYGNYDGAGQSALDSAARGADFWSGSVGYFFYGPNGQSVGSFSGLDGTLRATFDVNFTPVSPTYPAKVPTTYVVQAGDTLRTIAAKLFGDGSLWYLIAEANGLSDPDTPIEQGRTLDIPSDVVSLRNDANTFKPFDIGETLGDTTPTQPTIPPPPPKRGGGCGVIGMILIIVVAVVVTVFTAGAAALALGPGLAGATAGTIAAAGVSTIATAGIAGGLAAAAIGGAVGSIVSQGVAIAIGAQEKFSWKGVATSALGSVVTAGLAGVASGAGKVGEALQAFQKSSPYLYAAANAAAGSAITQGIAVATGLQESFSWKNVAIAAVAAPLAKFAGDKVGGFIGGAEFDPTSQAPSFAKFASDVAGSLTTSAVRAAFGGKMDTKEIIADAFGNALGNSIVDTIAFESDLSDFAEKYSLDRKKTPEAVRALYEHQRGDKLLRPGELRASLREAWVAAGAPAEHVDAVLGVYDRARLTTSLIPTVEVRDVTPTEAPEAPAPEPAPAAAPAPATPSEPEVLAPQTLLGQLGNGLATSIYDTSQTAVDLLGATGRVLNDLGKTIGNNPWIGLALTGLEIAAGPAMFLVRKAFNAVIGDKLQAKLGEVRDGFQAGLMSRGETEKFAGEAATGTAFFAGLLVSSAVAALKLVTGLARSAVRKTTAPAQTRGVNGPNEGAPYAKEVRPGGNGQAVAGHGELRRGDGTFEMHDGTTMVMPRDGISILDDTGQLLERIDLDRFAAAGPAAKKRLIRQELDAMGIQDKRVRNRVLADLDGVRVVKPGQTVQNYTVKPPDKLSIYEKSTTVDAAKPLSEVVKPNSGVCSFAACTVPRR